MTLLLDLTLILVGLTSFLYLFFTKKYQYWKTKNIVCEKPAIPFGNLTSVFFGKTSIGLLLQELYNKFDNVPYFGFYSFCTPSLVLKDPELIKAVLIKDFDNFKNKKFASNEKADPIIYHSLFGAQSDKWKHMRSKLSPIFTSGKLKHMLPLMKECCHDLTQYLLKNQDNERQEMKEVCSKLTTDVIASCAFGVKANSFEYEDAEFCVAGRKIFTFTLKRSFHTICYFFAPIFVHLFHLKFIEPSAANFLTNAFWQVLKERESGRSKARNDLIDILLDLKKEDPDMDGYVLPSQAITFFAAGHETTASTISFTLYELALNPNIQEKLRAEVLDVYKKYGDVTYEAMQDMSYLQMVISETLRKYPFGAFLTRMASKDYKFPGHNLVLEKGKEVLISLFGLHYNPEYYPEPEKFNPERFSEQNKRSIPQCTYLPFGDGPRNCIGERFGLVVVKLALCTILKDFKAVRGNETPDKIVFNPRAPILEAKGGIPIKLVKI